MGLIQQQVQGWNWLKQQVNKINDPALRNAMMVEFKKRALRDWGYCPDDGTMATEADLDLTSWERELLDDIRKAEKYQIDTRVEKHKETHKQALAAMRAFVEHGGTLMDIPEHIRTDAVEKLFYEAVHKNVDELLARLEALDENDRPSVRGIAC